MVVVRDYSPDADESPADPFFADHPAVTLLIEPRSGAIIDANADACAWYGWTRDELLAMRVEEIDTLPAEKVRAAMAAALMKRRSIRDSAHRLAGGTIRDVEVVSVPVEARGRKLLYAVVRDVTGRKRAEEELKRSQVLLTSSLEAQRDTIILCIDEDYRYLYFNEAHLDVMRNAYGADIEVGMCVLDCITDAEDRVVAKENYDRALAGESHSNVRVFGDVQRAYYESFFNPIVDESGQIIGATGLARDITARKSAEEQLAAQAARLQILADASAAFAEVGQSYEAVLETVVRSAAEALADVCQVRLLSEDGKRPTLAALHALEPGASETLRALDSQMSAFANGSATMLSVVRTGEPAFVPVVSADDVRASVPPELWPAYEPFAPHSCILVPLRAQGRVMGLLSLARTRSERPAFTQDDLTLAETLAGRAALAISNARLLAQVQEELAEREHAEAGLRESEERYRVLAESSPDMIFVVDRDDRVQYANVRAAEIVGHSPEAVVGMARIDLFAGETIGQMNVRMKARLDDVFQSGEARYSESELICPPGNLWITTWLVPIKDELGTVTAVLGTSRDITERKRAEEELRERAAEMAALHALGVAAARSLSLDEVAAGATAALAKALGCDLALLFLRDGERLLLAGACPAHEQAERKDAPEHRVGRCLCGLAVSEGVPIYSRDIFDDERCTLEECKQAGLRSFAALPLRAGDEIIGVVGVASESKRDFEAQAAFLETLASVVSLHAHNARLFSAIESQREALRERETALADAQGLAHIGVWRWTASTDTVTWTEELYRIAGLDPRLPAPTYAEHSDVYAPESWSRLQTAVEKALETGEPYQLELELIRPDGATRWVNAFGGAVHDDHGRAEGLHGTLQDITERKRAEDEIDCLTAELKERVVSRTEQRDAATKELEAFAYSVAHDVRTPLRAIDGFSEMVLEDEGSSLSAEAVEHLGRAREAAQRMACLLDDVLGLSRVSRRDLHRGPVDLSRLASEVADELRAEQPQRKVEFTVAPHLIADADQELIRVLLRELLANAWKFTGRRDVAHVEVGALDTSGERAFYVCDDGAGFDMRFAEHLFGAFQRMHAREEFEGDGIGLATVQRVVRRHGGGAWAEAEVEKGATFYFTLPAVIT